MLCWWNILIKNKLIQLNITKNFIYIFLKPSNILDISKYWTKGKCLGAKNMRGNQRSNTEPKLCMIYSTVWNCILILAHHHFHGRKGDWDKTHYYKLHYLLNEFIKLRINHSLETSHRVQKSVLYICVSTETCILSRVKQITSPGWMHEISARTWCTGKTRRDRVEREVGGGIGMGNTCKSMAKK